MEKAIICKWECPSCGNFFETEQVFVKNSLGTKYTFEGPSKSCPCGRKGGFTMMSFESGTATIVPDSKLENGE